MLKALKSYIVLGVKTPIDFLMNVLQSEPFSRGQIFTNFIDLHFSDWQPDFPYTYLACIVFIADEMAGRRKRMQPGSTNKAVATPWQTLGNWR